MSNATLKLMVIGAARTQIAGDGLFSIQLVAVNADGSKRFVSFGSSEQTDDLLKSQLEITA